MPDVTEPIIVNPNPVPSQVYTGLRDLGLVVAAVPTITALLGKHDIIGLINWASSSSAAPALSVVVTAAIFFWRQWNARQAKAEKVVLASAAPDDVAIVQSSPSSLTPAAAGQAGSDGPAA